MAKDKDKKEPFGRPRKYKEEYNEQARKLCLLGFTDVRLAEFFCIAESTLHKWKHDFPDFSEFIMRGKEFADSNVAVGLYERAKGYSHDDIHISNYQGEITETKIIKHYPPETGAIKMWLVNRQPELWRDKQVTELEGKVEVENHNIDYGTLTPEEAQRLFMDAINSDKK